MKYGILSDKGNIRKNNEDYIQNMKVSEKSHLFVLADGMGGHQKGDVASKTAAEAVVDYFRRHIEIIQKLYREEDTEKVREFVKRAIMFANEKVYKMSLEEDMKGMGTTLVVTYIMESKAMIANVGDSRAYSYRGAKLTQLTTDNSYVQELVQLGVITEEEARNHEKKNMITRAIGTELDLEIDFYELPLEKNDIILMCSDGLSNMVEPSDMEEILAMKYLPMFACEQLIREAKLNGGFDNISIILIYC